jgi:mRNA interferase MazF
VVISQGDIWWTELPPGEGSTAGFPRPLLVVQGDALNRTAIPTVLCVPLTSNLAFARAAGNVALAASETGLSKDSVALLSQTLAVDRPLLRERMGRLGANGLYLVFQALDVVLGR